LRSAAGKAEIGSKGLNAEADSALRAVREAFWCATLEPTRSPLDGRKEPVGSCVERRQVLFTGIARQERAVEVAKDAAAGVLLRRGIRTVAKAEARYNPMSYHNGSIWPHDNALISLGFARYEPQA